ncbi:MAG TPA: pilus assembly protein PilZ [Sphingomonas sp.]|jgi:hypothetical protein|nr:pilus assembly protein PilZ [Sphingomonas sp.]
MEQPTFTPPFDAIDDDARRALRKSVKMRAHLRDRGQTRFEIEVTDLSMSGFRAETSFTLWPGTIVWLTLPGLAALEAVVAWRDKYKYGCAFAKPLHPAVFEHIVALSMR